MTQANTMTLQKSGLKGRRRLQSASDNVFSFAYLAPFLFIFFIFTLAPVVISLLLSFTNFNGFFYDLKVVGFDNYTHMILNNDEFLMALNNTMVIAVFAGPCGYLASLLLAWFINELNPRIRAFMVLIFYAPSISGGAYMIFQLLFGDDAYNYINGWLLNMNLISAPIQFTKNTSYMLPLAIAVVLWMSLGTGFLAFVAGLQGVDKTYYEVGYIEGIRNRWQELWYITLPTMRPQLMFGAVMSITTAFGVGEVTEQIFGMPSTDYAAHTFLNFIKDYGSLRFEMGYASAAATLLFGLMLISHNLVQKGLRGIGK